MASADTTASPELAAAEEHLENVCKAHEEHCQTRVGIHGDMSPAIAAAYMRVRALRRGAT